MATETLVNNAVTHFIPCDNWHDDGRSTKTFRVHLLIAREEDGTYSAIALNLPGAGSCGDTAEEAVEHAREAVCGAVESYLEDSEEIPWKDTSDVDIPSEAVQKWIIVNV